MNNYCAIGLYVFSGLVAAFSQLVLKLTAIKPNGKQGVMQFIDFRIVIAYGMLMGTLFINMIAMRYIPYKYAPVLSSVSYVFVLILGRFFLHETIGKKKWLGILLIFIGMVVFYVGE